jgi:hypothetical protein
MNEILLTGVVVVAIGLIAILLAALVAGGHDFNLGVKEWLSLSTAGKSGRADRDARRSLTVLLGRVGAFSVAAGLVLVLVGALKPSDNPSPGSNSSANKDRVTATQGVDLPKSAAIKTEWKDGCSSRLDPTANVALTAEHSDSAATYKWTLQTWERAFIEEGAGRVYSYLHNCQTNGDRFIAKLTIQSAAGTIENEDTIFVGNYRVDPPDAAIHTQWLDPACNTNSDPFATVMLSAVDAGPGATYSWNIETSTGQVLNSGSRRTHEYRHNCQVHGDRFVAKLQVTATGATASNGDTVFVPR